MVAIIIALSICLPILEVLLFAWIISIAGMWAVIIPSIVTSALGAGILIRYFPRFLNSTTTSDKFSTFPTMQSYYDVTLIVSGFMLLVPGFITDIIGLVLLHPRLRGVTFVLLARIVTSRKDTLIPVDRHED